MISINKNIKIKIISYLDVEEGIIDKFNFLEWEDLLNKSFDSNILWEWFIDLTIDEIYFKDDMGNIIKASSDYESVILQNLWKLKTKVIDRNWFPYSYNWQTAYCSNCGKEIEDIEYSGTCKNCWLYI